MKSGYFAFKKFEVRHTESSMKVGVDAVLLAAWVNLGGQKVLEVGGGCGVISLMLAQRYPDAFITAIDIDKGSVRESDYNFNHSPWPGRLKSAELKFPEDVVCSQEKFDLIISNPPFFDAGIKNPLTSREKARHQGDLSVFSLLDHGGEILNEGGKLSVIFPADQYHRVKDYAAERGWVICRECRVRNNIRTPEKRVMIEFVKGNNGVSEEIEIERVTLFSDGGPTERYRELCSAFYLKF